MRRGQRIEVLLSEILAELQRHGMELEHICMGTAYSVEETMGETVDLGDVMADPIDIGDDEGPDLGYL